MLIPAAPIYLLRVFAFGLIAYVSGDAGNRREVNILLVDTTHPITATDGCPIRKHEPLLIYEPKAWACEAWCRAESGVCVCPLEREAIFLDNQLVPIPSRLDRSEFDRYVPILQDAFSGRQKTEGVRPPKWWIREVVADCLFRDKTQRVCPFVAAEAILLPERVYACEMARGIEHHYELPKKGDRAQEGQEFSFRSLSQGEFEVMRKQNVATKQVFVSELDGASVIGGQYLDISVQRFDETQPPKRIRITDGKCPADACWKSLKNCTENLYCFDVALANVPIHADQNLLYGRCQAHGI